MFVVNIASQVTPNTYCKKQIKLINPAFERAHAFQERGLPVHRLDESSLRIAVFADDSFTNNGDFSMKLGLAVFLCDSSNKENCL